MASRRAPRSKAPADRKSRAQLNISCTQAEQQWFKRWMRANGYRCSETVVAALRQFTSIPHEERARWFGATSEWSDKGGPLPPGGPSLSRPGLGPRPNGGPEQPGQRPRRQGGQGSGQLWPQTGVLAEAV